MNAIKEIKVNKKSLHNHWVLKIDGTTNEFSFVDVCQLPSELIVYDVETKTECMIGGKHIGTTFVNAAVLGCEYGRDVMYASFSALQYYTHNRDYFLDVIVSDDEWTIKIHDRADA